MRLAVRCPEAAALAASLAASAWALPGIGLSWPEPAWWFLLLRWTLAAAWLFYLLFVLAHLAEQHRASHAIRQAGSGRAALEGEGANSSEASSGAAADATASLPLLEVGRRSVLVSSVLLLRFWAQPASGLPAAFMLTAILVGGHELLAPLLGARRLPASYWLAAAALVAPWAIPAFSPQWP